VPGVPGACGRRLASELLDGAKPVRGIAVAVACDAVEPDMDRVDIVSESMEIGLSRISGEFANAAQGLAGALLPLPTPLILVDVDASRLALG